MNEPATSENVSEINITNAEKAWFQNEYNLRFGRYSDNNKTPEQLQFWYQAEDRFGEKNYTVAFSAFFKYLRDDATDNVTFRPDGKTFQFYFSQGSKKITGESDGENITARAPLGRMKSNGTAIMRRLLELNYTLYYTHSAMDEAATLFLVFQTDLATATPGKLYYGLRELATKADRQDDVLLADFESLKPVGNELTKPLPDAVLEIKYRFFRKWIEEALATISDLNDDSFSGAIAYVLLSLIYRIDFLIVPEGLLRTTLEKISSIYWDKKEIVTLVKRNKEMMDEVRKLLDLTREDFAKSVYQYKATFSAAPTPKDDKLKEHIIAANKDSHWYMENNYPQIALLIVEYGLTYNQFIYSMPEVQTQLVAIFMSIMHADYFEALGITPQFYNPKEKTFNPELMKAAIDNALKPFSQKFKSLKWDHQHVSYTSLYDFGITFSEHLANMNLETKREAS